MAKFRRHEKKYFAISYAGGFLVFLIITFVLVLCFANEETNNIDIDVLVQKVSKEECLINECPAPEQADHLVCGFNAESTYYKMFPSRCAMKEYAKCYKDVYTETPLEFCIKEHNKALNLRRMYGESCPVFCPAYWRPVCGASKLKSYVYRTFNNGCYMDMLNCRGEDEDLGYVEVPLEYCQRHSMKNMYKEKIMTAGIHEYRDYEY